VLIEFNAVSQVARIRVYAPSLRVVSTSIQPSQAAAGASPYTYTNTTGSPIAVYVSGGTVTAIDIKRNGAGVTTGLTAGSFVLAQNDAITVTHTGAPTVTFMQHEQR
jgi:hypothetical protein